MKKTFLFVLFLSQFIFSQEVTIQEISDKFSQNQKVQWAVPLSENEHISVLWNERKSSLSEKEGIKTFAGYIDNQFIGVISIFGENISGEILWKGKSYRIGTSKNKMLLISQEKTTKKCSSCLSGKCHLESKKKPAKLSSKTPKLTELDLGYVMPNDDVLRIYRLAMPISYNTFRGPSNLPSDSRFLGFDSNIDKVKTFWANTEVALNELYMRDIGVKFQIVNDDKLIITDASKNVFEGDTGSTVIDHSTKGINKLIGEENYDVGIYIVNPSIKDGGLAIRGAAFKKEVKGGAMSLLKFSTIAHEIGHMFGSIHTHIADGGNGSYFTEVGYGNSIMGYGEEDNDFFSLISALKMRQMVLSNPYFSNKERTAKVGDADFTSNFPYGIKMNNKPPKIDTTKLKNYYTIPRKTYFQFSISATDPENKPLWYMAQPANIGKSELAQFLTYKPSRKNTIAFQQEYTFSGNVKPYTEMDARAGTYIFWLGVSDANPDISQDYITQYDMFQTEVNIIEAKPFVITTQPQKKYQQGDKILLKWDVEESIFKDTKVRILLSDDLGKTYKYTLNAETENDGEQEIILPNIVIGQDKEMEAPGGVIKIEVIDHIAFATTNRDPFENGETYGGFEILPNSESPQPLKWVENSLPKDENYTCRASVPTASTTNLQVTGGSGTAVVSVSESIENEQCTNKVTIKRVFTAKEGTEQISHTQTIIVNDDVKPTFEGTLPSNISVEEGQTIPAQTDLTAKDNCGTASVEKSFEDISENGKLKKKIYKWIAKDLCGNTTEHRQEIVVKPKSETPPAVAPPVVTPPSVPKIPDTPKTPDFQSSLKIYNGISTEITSENYFRFEGIDTKTPISVEIFNELGQKVYQTNNYGKNGNVFRGYPNAKGVFSPSKRLPTGTYFYILKYENTNKSGYLFVR